MKKNKKQQYDYLLNCINNASTNIDREQAPTTQEEAIKNVYNDILCYFKGFANGYYQTFREASFDYLQGMGINTIDFYNSQIIAIGQSWGYCNTDKQKENFLLNWWRCTNNNLMHIFEQNGLNTNIYWRSLL